MEKETEAMVSLLIYCGIAGIFIAVGSWIGYQEYKRRRENRIFDRKEFILDQYLLRLKELSILIEETWQKKQQKP